MEELSQEEFNKAIKQEDFKLINGVAFAHSCYNSSHRLTYKKAFGHYPKEYKVTEDQIKKAIQIRTKKQNELIKKYQEENTLIFIGMGCTFESKKGFINNHRIRAKFINKQGIKCFIEVGTGKDNKNMRCDHSIFNYCEKWNSIKERESQEKNNYKNLEGSISLKYTSENLLKLVNKAFNCNFKKLVIDEFILTCDKFTSISEV